MPLGILGVVALRGHYQPVHVAGRYRVQHAASQGYVDEQDGPMATRPRVWLSRDTGPHRRVDGIIPTL